MNTATGEGRSYPARLVKIRTLKDKVIELQKELKRIERTEMSPIRCDGSVSPKKSEEKKYQTLTINPINATLSPKFKNPNFWGSNPIVAEQTYQSMSSKSRKSLNRRSPSKPSNELVLEIVDGASRDFYRRNTASPEKEMLSQTCKNLGSTISRAKENDQAALNPEGFSTHFSLKSFSRLPLQKLENVCSRSPDRNTPRFKKVSAIKTFIQRNVDPILRPPAQKKSQRKLCRARNQSPLNLLTEHEKSNTRMYLSPSKTPIFLSPQNRTCRKNKSDIIKDLLNHSSELHKTDAKDKVGKRHYACHFQETLRNMVYL